VKTDLRIFPDVQVIYTMPTNKMSDTYAVVAFVLLGLECVTGFVCNLTILCRHRRHKFNMNSSPQYGNLFITNLNGVDMFISSIAIPLTMAVVLLSERPLIVCYLHESGVSSASSASAVTVLLISLDRYGAVVTPMRRKITTTNMKYFAGMIWSVAFVGFCLPLFGLLNVSDHVYVLSNISDTADNMTISCRHILRHANPYYFYELYHLLIFMVSLLVMLVCYITIVKVARRRLVIKRSMRTTNIVLNNSTDSNNKKQDKRLTTMTLALVSSFIVCWGPHALITITELVLDGNEAVDVIQLYCLVIAYSSTTFHPLLYTLLHRHARLTSMTSFVGRRSSRVGQLPPVSLGMEITPVVRCLGMQTTPVVQCLVKQSVLASHTLVRPTRDQLDDTVFPI
jgi:G protein-coupled receptor 22